MGKEDNDSDDCHDDDGDGHECDNNDDDDAYDDYVRDVGIVLNWVNNKHKDPSTD